MSALGFITGIALIALGFDFAVSFTSSFGYVFGVIFGLLFIALSFWVTAYHLNNLLMGSRMASKRPATRGADCAPDRPRLVELKLDKLQGLRDDRLITNDEYHSKRLEILEAMEEGA